MNADTQSTPTEPKVSSGKHPVMLVLDLLLVIVLLAGAYLRTAGLYWGEYQYLHPDERFLVWVGSDISPTKLEDNGQEIEKSWISLSEYFDTQNSTLNPNNRGHGFYVYGTLPMFITRFAVEWIFDRSGFDVMTQVGRAFSAAVDLLTVLLVYLIAARIYDRRVGLLAAAFSAAAVLQIQQSHFFTMDTFSNLFAYLSIYFAVRIMTDKRPWPAFSPPDVEEAASLSIDEPPSAPAIEQAASLSINEPASAPAAGQAVSSPIGLTGNSSNKSSIKKTLSKLYHHPLLWLSIAFGLAYGAAMASKISIIPIAILLPAAIAIRISTMPRSEWGRRALQVLPYLILAGAVSLIVFRLAQPYAFSGPGLLGLKPNPEWLRQIREQRSQATIEVDFPPAMQWARRPIWFSFQNLTIWGLGLPLGILAWLGFLWAGWEMLKGKWRTHLLLWGWTGAFFAWQSLALNPTMRYQLPIYPSLAIFAAWGVVHLWDVGKARLLSGVKPRLTWQQITAILVGGLVLAATFAYAVAFIGIYQRPVTRIEGSRWIYQNVPGPINLRLQTEDGLFQQPLPFPYNGSILPGMPYTVNFTPQESGELQEVFLPRVSETLIDSESSPLNLTINGPDGTQLSTTNLTLEPSASSNSSGQALTFQLEQPVTLDKGQNYSLRLDLTGRPPAVLLNSQASLRFISDNGLQVDTPAFPNLDGQWQGASANGAFAPESGGVLREIFLPASSQPLVTDQPVTLVLNLQLNDGEPGSLPEKIIALPVLQNDSRGAGYLFRLSQPLYLNAAQKVNYSVAIQEAQNALTLSGAGLANEGEWDDGMPLRIDGYDGFGGIYPLDLNFNMYWDDDPTKLERFLRIIDQSDYIVITSNRQWGSLPRIPERFPLTTLYYRSLLGCPPDQEIVSCYQVAEPGMFKGELGFELVKIFQSDPQIGPLRINDQFAEEAFTVYDHPKVLIFKKTPDYNAQQVEELLSSIDFGKVIRLAPLKFKGYPADLQLPAENWEEQQSGGTWSALFNTEAWQNRSQAASVLVWYLSLAVLGLLIYPLVRLALPGLNDHGYPLARTAGLLVLSYLVWIAGSAHIAFTRTTISLALLLILGVGGLLAYYQRHELRQEWRERKGYFLMIEGLFLAFFVLDLLIRLGNPDLWHPYKGGEKPMDFAYFNAVLKSTSFPPYDPWFAGGYLNYYYYGFVLVGAMVKWLGIVPAVAYNLILPSMFALIAMGAFSIAWNIYCAGKSDRTIKPIWVGLAGGLGMALLGNLGTVKMIYEGFQRLAAPAGALDNSNVLMRLAWAAQGFLKNLAGSPLPFGIGDWYWNPSRIIPAPGEIEPITEFPFFTVLYADPHAHLFALPLALLAVGFALSIVLAGGRWKNILAGCFGFLLGGLAIGALRPTNTWDFYTYLVLGALALAYAIGRNFKPPAKDSSAIRIYPGFIARLPEAIQKWLVIGGSILLLTTLSLLLYQPFVQWYGQAYGKVDFWLGLRTPLLAYLTHWGLFFFVVVSWMAWETRDWLASTPVSALRKLQPFRGLIFGTIGFLFLLMLGLVIKLPQPGRTPFGNGIAIAWVALPLAAWAGSLILRPNQSDAKRFTLFLIGTGLTLTLVVESFVLVGDIGRMNTVFKFYLQVWTLMAICAAAALGWLLSTLAGWLPGWRAAWSVGLALLVAGAALYPLTAARAKILDRMAEQAPHTLDGMKYMEYATYDWVETMDLSQDYRAIRWMQENVSGSPVIVEANLRDLYRWGSRFSIYTGLPGVVGWEWHQQQQRALTPGIWVSERISEIDNFYNTSDLQAAQDFLKKYGVKYFVVGQLERNIYPGPGLDKFPAQNGVLWQEVFRDQDTAIYQVTE